MKNKIDEKLREEVENILDSDTVDAGNLSNELWPQNPFEQRTIGNEVSRILDLIRRREWEARIKEVKYLKNNFYVWENRAADREIARMIGAMIENSLEKRVKELEVENEK